MNSRKRKRDENSTIAKALQYFKFFREEQIDGTKKIMYTCNLCDSNANPLNGTKPHNLVSHLQRIHPNKFELIDEKKDIKLKRLELLQNIVEMVTVNGRPFTSISDSGFRSIIENKLKKFDKAGCPLNLSDANLPEVKKNISETASRVREKIKEEVCGRALSLIADIGTKNRRSIFGISIQYCINGKSRVRSIGMIELLKSNTGKYLADVIRSHLKLYEIDLRQILTITTDNGKNILKMVRDFGSIMHNEIDSTNNEQASSEYCTNTEEFIESNSSGLQTDDEINEVLKAFDEKTDEEALEEIFDEALLRQHENLLNEMSQHLVADFGLEILHEITGVNCAAHTLQLSIKDALNLIAKNNQNVIKLCREVAKSLRLKSTQHIFKTHGGSYRLPRLDVETRWGSTYMMVGILFVSYFCLTFRFLSMLISIPDSRCF